MKDMLIPREKPVPVDSWVCPPEDELFKFSKKAIILPISEFYGNNSDPNLDLFIMSKKRSYNRELEKTSHTTQYLNYLIKFYDIDKEILIAYYKLKVIIDREPLYTPDMFINDCKVYFMTTSILDKVNAMVRDNYILDLSYKNNANPSLQYSNKHGKILMAMSIMMNVVIPIASHFIYVKGLDPKGLLLRLFNIILDLSPSVDMYTKIYNTVTTNVNQTKHTDPVLWGKQDIRGINASTHTQYCIENILINMMPKYTFDKNIICFNFSSIKMNVNFQIREISYEFNFIKYSSYDRDDDFNSAFDKFESYQITQNEGFYVQNKVNSRATMDFIEQRFGPFSNEEVSHYRKALSEDNSNVINDFQYTLISNLFFKYFGEPNAFKAINSDDYIKLMIAAKRLLLLDKMYTLPFVISSKIRNIQNRKSINKKEMTKVELSDTFKKVEEKYNSQQMRQFILSLLATASSSEFKVIDFNNENGLDGKILNVIPDLIYKELETYVLLV